jgi:hypothetical protein
MGSGQRLGERKAVGALACAISGAVLALLLAAAGCQSEDPDTGLNPRPEELPSASDNGSSASPAPTNVERETCEDNALLAGCEPGTPPESNAAPDEDPISLGGGEPDAGASPNDATLGVDAGALSVGDAGAP